MKTYAELAERRTTLSKRGFDAFTTFMNELAAIARDRQNLQKAIAEYGAVYGYNVDTAADDEDIIIINLRQAVSPELKDGCLLLNGIAEVMEEDRYTLSIRKGAAFNWDEIQTQFDELYGKLTDPIILAAAQQSANDPVEGDVSAETGQVAQPVWLILLPFRHRMSESMRCLFRGVNMYFTRNATPQQVSKPKKSMKMRVMIDGKEYHVENDVRILYEGIDNHDDDLHVILREEGMTVDLVGPEVGSERPINGSAYREIEELIDLTTGEVD